VETGLFYTRYNIVVVVFVVDVVVIVVLNIDALAVLADAVFVVGKSVAIS
jgi:hypothetical protein